MHESLIPITPQTLRCTHRLPTGRTCLHYAAGYGHEQLVTLLLNAGASPAAVDANLDTALHLAASSNQPHALFNLVQVASDLCISTNKRGKTPIDIAADCNRSEVGTHCCKQSMHIIYTPVLERHAAGLCLQLLPCRPAEPAAAS